MSFVVGIIGIATMVFLAGIVAGSWITTPGKHHIRTQQHLVYGTWVLALGTLLSVGIGYCTLQDNRNALQLTERPYVWLTNDLGNPSFYLAPGKTAGQIIWDWHYTNYGRTPAVNVRFVHYIRLGNSARKKSYLEPEMTSLGPPLTPNKVDFATVVLDPDVSADDANKWLHTDEAIEISGDILYSGISGGSYRTTFCISKLALSAIKYCPEGNDIK